MKQECTASVLNQMESFETARESVLAYNLSHSSNNDILQISSEKYHLIKKWRICFF